MSDLTLTGSVTEAPAYLLEPFFTVRGEIWQSRCIYCKRHSPGVPGDDDLAALGAMFRARWSFIRVPGPTHHPVCPDCVQDPANKWNGLPVSRSILPRLRRS